MHIMYQLMNELLYSVHDKTIQYSRSVHLNSCKLTVQAIQVMNTQCQLLMSHIYHYVDYASHTKTRQLLLRLRSLRYEGIVLMRSQMKCQIEAPNLEVGSHMSCDIL